MALRAYTLPDTPVLLGCLGDVLHGPTSGDSEAGYRGSVDGCYMFLLQVVDLQ